MSYDPANLQRLVQQYRSPPPARSSESFGAGFSEREITIGTDVTRTGGWRQLPNCKGKKFVYRRGGSFPGGAFQLRLNGQNMGDIFPGTIITAPFETAEIQMHPRSCRGGKARFTTFANPSDGIVESANDGIYFEPYDLLGSVGLGPDHAAFGATSFVTIAEDTALNTSTQVFDVTGVRKLRVWLDMVSAAAAATTVDLVPKVVVSADAVLTIVDNAMGRISVPDSSSSGEQYRVLSVDIDALVPKTLPQQFLLGFEVRNLLAAARTSVGMCVEAIG